MKNYLLTFIFLIITCSLVSAQANILANSDFNEQGEWKVVQGQAEPVSVEFGSTEYEVNGGEGANMLIEHAPIAEEQVFVYQEVELEADKEYIFSLAIHDVSSEYGCWWVQLFYSSVEPIDGEDITENHIAQVDEWHENFEGFNGLIDTFSTEQGERINDTIFSVTESGTYYLGINFGGCGAAGSYAFVFDNLELLDPDLEPEVSVVQIHRNENKFYIYPNPASSNLEFSYSLSQGSDIEINLINSLGQKVVTLNDGFKIAGMHKQSFNCSNLANGLYFGVLRTDDSMLIKKIIISK